MKHIWPSNECIVSSLVHKYKNFQGILSSNFLTPFTYQRQYLIVNHIGAIRAEHDDFTVRFASAMSQVTLSLTSHTHMD
uniref:Uncharacterized protein n=1 Tax=Solanum lycopersicum TaxID=4081 RepID=A0A3Q7ISA5_SOLLC